MTGHVRLALDSRIQSKAAPIASACRRAKNLYSIMRNRTPATVGDDIEGDPRLRPRGTRTTPPWWHPM